MISKKKYVILTPNLSGIGGAQLYCLRRLKHLVDKNYEVIILTSVIRDFKLKNSFEKIKILEFDEFKYSHFFFSKKKRKDIINTIIKNIKEIDVIESNSIDLSIWGEELACFYRCKHIAYLLNENPIWNDRGSDVKNMFFRLDLENRLIAISDLSLSLILKKQVENNRYVNVPFDENELSSSKEFELKKYFSKSIIIGTASRLEKAYVARLIKDVNLLAKENVKINYELFIVGYTSKKNLEKELRSLDKKLNNLKIHWLGTIYPLPKLFFKQLDLYVGMGTGAVSSISQKTPTIVVDPRNSLSIGIFGVSIFNFGYGLKHQTIKESIEELIGSEELIEASKIKGRELYEKEYSIKGTMNKLDSYVKNISPNENKSFEINYKINHIQFIRKMIFRILGKKIYDNIIFSFQEN